MNVTYVLLRGWTRERRHWRDFPELLGQTTGGKVVAIDLPGTGSENLRASPTNIRAIMEDTRKRFRQDSPAVVIGISMGGMVALDWVSQYPEDFKGIVLINSSLAGLSKSWERLNFKNLPELLKILPLKKQEEIEKKILSLTSSLPIEKRAQIAREFARFVEDAPIQKTTLLKQLLAAARFSLRDFPKCPALVISSQNDNLVHPSCSTKLASHLSALAAIHPSAGHDLPLDDGPWLAREIASWQPKLEI